MMLPLSSYFPPLLLLSFSFPLPQPQLFSFPPPLPPLSSSAPPLLLHRQPSQHHQPAFLPPFSSCTALYSSPHPWSWGPTLWPFQSPPRPAGTFPSPPSLGLVCQMPGTPRQD